MSPQPYILVKDKRGGETVINTVREFSQSFSYINSFKPHHLKYRFLFSHQLYQKISEALRGPGIYPNMIDQGRYLANMALFGCY